MEQLLDYGRRAHLLLLPILTESHWTLLAVERQREPQPPALEALPSSGPAEASAVAGCQKCREREWMLAVRRCESYFPRRKD